MTRRQALIATAGMAAGKTNTYAALMSALDAGGRGLYDKHYDSQVDTIYFLSDGNPSTGEYVEKDEILAEVRRVLRPSGHFLFSSHSTGALPLETRPEGPSPLSGSRLYALFSRATAIRFGWRVRKVNRKLDLRLAAERGWIIVSGRGQNFQVDDYYVDPEYQVEQLRDAGFEVEAIFDVAGRDVTLPHHGRDPWLDYLCRASG